MNTIVIDRTSQPVRMQERLNGDVEITAWIERHWLESRMPRTRMEEVVVAVIPKSKRLLVAGFLKEFTP